MSQLSVSFRFVVVIHMPVVCNDRCPGYVPQLQFINKVVYTPVVAQSLIPMASHTIEILLLPYTCGRCPCCVGRASSTVAVSEETVALRQLQLFRTSIGCRHHPGRGAEAVSHGLADRGNSPVSLRQGDRRPCCVG